MSLAFALMTAINGSTGSSATLSHGLKGTKPHRRQSTAARILIPHGRRRKPSRTLSHKGGRLSKPHNEVRGDEPERVGGLRTWMIFVRL